jgi:hypothetical protein
MNCICTCTIEHLTFDDGSVRCLRGGCPCGALKTRKSGRKKTRDVNARLAKKKIAGGPYCNYPKTSEEKLNFQQAREVSLPELAEELL